MPDLYVYDEPSMWGREVAMAAGRAGIPVTFFKKPQEVPEGAVAFVRLDQYRERRDISRLVVKKLHDRGVRTLPSAEDARLYDDKAAQYEVLSAFMPETHVIRDPATAADLAERLDYPLVSKSIEGANAANVRLLPDTRSARAEVEKVFNGRGLPMTYGRRQRGYVYWQRFVPDNPRDYRVIIVGNYGWGLVRENRANVPFASGSGVNRGLTLETERERSAFDFGWLVRDHLQTDMVGLDIVFDGNEPRLLETTSSWTIGPHVTSPVFDRDGAPTPYVRGHQWDLIVKVLDRYRKEAH